MSTITDPIMLDSTGQAIKNSIDLLAANINRTASNIPYDSNLTIKGKIDSMETVTTGSATLNPDLDLASGGYVVWVKKGKLVFVTYSFTLNSNPSNTAELITGLPPMELVSGAYNWVTFQNMSNGLSERAALSATGKVANAYGFFVRTGDHNGSFCYIAQ